MQSGVASRWPTVALWFAALWTAVLTLVACSSGSEPLQCAAPLVDCGGSCVDLSLDPDHCGQCPVVCAEGELCTLGTCSNPCGEGQASCNGECVSLSSDNRYCGRCDLACAAGEFCMAGVCSAQCGFQVCPTLAGAECADLSSNALHCGTCGQACQAQFACVSGSCQLACDAPLTACNNAECADLLTSNAHCGMCNTACPEGSSCQGGQCLCTAPYLLCGATCIDVMSSAEHCGGCSTPCQEGYVCNGGSCACPMDRMVCGDQCVDLMSDALHCGGCDSPCRDGDSCDAGRCVGADGCGGLAHDITVTEVAVYQTVKIALVENGQEVAVADRNADVVADREAIFRVFAEVGSAFASRELSARVRLLDGGMVQEFFAKATLTGSSSDEDVESTFNVIVPREAITTTARYSVEIVECAPGLGTVLGPVFPEQGDTELAARATGPLKIHLIPFSYNGFAPGTSATQLAYYKAFFEAMYPITELQFTTEDPVDAGDFSDLGVTLEQTFALRDEDSPADDVYYYGLARPADSLEDFCDGSCTLGVGFVTDTENAEFRAAVGVAFDDEPQMAAETFLHEIGHNHGREHAPCGGVSESDPSYPYSEGEIGVWGFDPRDDSLLPPDTADIMGYCGPQWISDYTYQALLNRVAALNNPAQFKVSSAVSAPEARFRVLHVSAKKPKWNRPFHGKPPNVAPETAVILNAQGLPIATVNVYRMPMHGVNAAMVLVPEPQPGWHSVQVAGTIAHPFGAPVEIKGRR